MPIRSVPHVLIVVFCGALLSVGCTRSRTGSPAGEESQLTPAARSASASITVTRPSSGVEVSSPIKVEGTVVLPSGRAVAAQVKSRDPDGELLWRGNGSLDADAAGYYEGEVAYVLEDAAPGIVEVLIIDPASGTVFERQEVEVSLLPSR